MRQMMMNPRSISHDILRLILVGTCFALLSCTILKTTYTVTKGTLKLGYHVTKFAGKTVYTIGKYTFVVVKAPFTWPLTQTGLESIDGLSPKEAIEQGRVKTSP
ncbi:MAG: hypothetical protein WBN03_13475, partial [Desulfobacterales bacterium]